MNDHSARGKKRKGASADKRERILRAAIEVFAQNGFYATRVSEIAKKAGVADGTIYLYFENKDDVLVSIFEDRIGTLLQVLQKIADKDATTEEKLREIILLQLGALEEQRDLAEVITVNLRQSSRLLKQYASPLFGRYLEIIAGVMKQGQKDGTIRSDISAGMAARALWGAMDGLALTWALGSPEGTPDPARLRQSAKQFAGLFLDGVRPRD